MKNTGVFGITGGIATGKTYACKLFQWFATEQGLKFHHISIDVLRRFLLGKSTDKHHKMIRKELAKRLAIRVKGRKGFIDSRDLGEKIFYEYKNMRIYRKIINREIRKMVRDKISKLKGIICVEWSQLLEDDLLPVVQGHVLWLYCTRKQQIERLSSSNSRLPWEQIKRRIAFQALSTNKMRGNINAEKVKVISFNTTGNPPKENYRGLFDRVLNSFGGAV